MSHEDTYMSVFEALRSAGWHHNTNVVINWINAENEDQIVSELKKVDGIVVPGGFGSRGIEGKIMAAKYARENSLPYLGLCLGMQVAVIEFARHVLKSKSVNSAEVAPNAKHHVVHIMPSQVGVEIGGSMRLGNYECVLDKNSRAFLAYGISSVHERHRHRYEFNNEYREILTTNGLVISGLSPDKKLVEIVELKNHPFFVASQFHPEYKSRPDFAHPLFKDFVGSSLHHAAKSKLKASANLKSTA